MINVKTSTQKKICKKKVSEYFITKYKERVEMVYKVLHETNTQENWKINHKICKEKVGYTIAYQEPKIVIADMADP